MIYTDALYDQICKKIANTSLGLKHILVGEEMPDRSTFYDWINKSSENTDKYAKAKALQADYMAEELLDIADDGANDLMTIVKGDNSYEQENKEVTNRSRLRVDSRKWLMSKILPKKYGDKLELGGEINTPVTNSQIDALINAAKQTGIKGDSGE